MDYTKFKSGLNGVLTSAKNVRTNVQALAMFALEQAQKHGNLTAASELVVYTKPVKSINSAQIERFIMAHISGVRWVANDDKRLTKKLVKVEDTKVKIKVTMPKAGVNWTDFEAPKVDKLPSALPLVTDEKRQKAIADYRGRLQATAQAKDGANRLRAQQSLLEAQLKAVKAEIEAQTPVIATAALLGIA